MGALPLILVASSRVRIVQIEKEIFLIAAKQQCLNCDLAGQTIHPPIYLYSLLDGRTDCCQPPDRGACDSQREYDKQAQRQHELNPEAKTNRSECWCMSRRLHEISPDSGLRRDVE